jgi:hypothetical protein
LQEIPDLLDHLIHLVVALDHLVVDVHTQLPNDQEQQPNGLNDQENRVFPANNNTKELEKDKQRTQGEENKENQKQSSVSTGSYSARKSCPSPSFAIEGNLEKEQNRTIFASKSLSPQANLNSTFSEDSKPTDNNDSGIKTDNTDEDCDDDESDDEVGGATSEDDEYEEDGSEEGSGSGGED